MNPVATRSSISNRKISTASERLPIHTDPEDCLCTPVPRHDNLVTLAVILKKAENEFEVYT